MTNSPDSDSQLGNISTNDIDQEVGGNAGLIAAQIFGGTAIGTQNITISFPHPFDVSDKTENSPLVSGENPYKGLEAFEEEDGGRFFGRDTEINGDNKPNGERGLLKRFHELSQNAIRILPIYGPSGSGKSSLVKAGLVHALRKDLKKDGRIIVMKPSEDPIRQLAKVLVHSMTDDLLIENEISDCKTELLRQNDTPEKSFDGLYRMIDSARQIESLILVVDQFEEIYTYQDLPDQRHAFIENLIYAASHPSQNVSVILTMRSDFLGKTQKLPCLNALFSSQGFLVPIMQKEQLAIAISEPAKRSGCKELTEETIIDLLLEQSRGQEGALPLLQFALTQIWEGLLTGIKPRDTLKRIGGVGGALANKAQEAYDSLKTDQEKQIARAIFLKLILLNDDNRSTRRRVPILNLVIGDHKEKSVREVVALFAQPKVRILVTSAPIDNPKLEIVEIAHEALIDNWEELKVWLRENKKVMLQRDEIERFRHKWESQNKSKDYLLQDRLLRDVLEFQQAQKENPETALSNEDKKFIKESINKQRTKTLKLTSVSLIFPLIGTLVFVHFQVISKANSILSRNDCNPDSEIKGFLEYMWLTGYANRLRDLKLCGKDLRRIKLPRAVMPNSNFQLTNLANSDFRGAMLANADFKGATLAYANFSGNAFLVGADFRCKETDCTALFGTNFQSSKLMESKFQGALLEDANFTNVDLTDANLEGAKGLTTDQLKDAVICRTTMPSYLTSIPQNRNCPP